MSLVKAKHDVIEAVIDKQTKRGTYMCRNIRNYCNEWSRQTYGEALEAIFNAMDENSANFSKQIRQKFRQTNLYTKYMNGNSVMGWPPNKEKGTIEGVTFSDLYHSIKENPYFSPALYMAAVIYELIDAGYPDGVYPKWIGRSLKTFASFMREEDCAYQLITRLQRDDPTVTFTSNPEQDAHDHTDILLNYLGHRYRIWSYQCSTTGLDHLRERLLGERGTLPDGVHILAPIDVFDRDRTEDECGWRFAAGHEVDNLCQLINNIHAGQPITLYDYFRQHLAQQNLRHINAFYKGELDENGNIVTF